MRQREGDDVVRECGRKGSERGARVRVSWVAGGAECVGASRPGDSRAADIIARADGGLRSPWACVRDCVGSQGRRGGAISLMGVASWRWASGRVARARSCEGRVVRLSSEFQCEHRRRCLCACGDPERAPSHAPTLSLRMRPSPEAELYESGARAAMRESCAHARAWSARAPPSNIEGICLAAF